MGALRLDNRPAISGLHPTAHERHGREKRSAIALKLILGGGDFLLSTKGEQLLKRSQKSNI